MDDEYINADRKVFETAGREDAEWNLIWKRGKMDGNNWMERR